MQAQSNRSWWDRLFFGENPASFSISKAEVDKMLTYKADETTSFKKNKYIDKASVQSNIANGDMRFMRIKLNYFDQAYLSVQVNGSFSTILYITSDNNAVSYKGKSDGENFVMIKCERDEIYSE